jgi:dolichyl-phosphooligosaccharide-protein glycotransferase
MSKEHHSEHHKSAHDHKTTHEHHSNEEKSHKQKNSFFEGFTKENIIKFGTIFLLLLILITVSSHIRLQTVTLSGFDQRAESLIVQNLQSQVQAQIDVQNPFLSPQQKEQLVQAQVNEYLALNKAEFELQKTTIANQLKSQFKHDDGQTYLLELDPYFYYRFTENTLNNGHMGEYLNADGLPASKLSLAPRESVFTQTTLHVEFAVFWHKLVNLFKDVPLHTTFFVIPVLIVGLAIIPAFFIGRKLGGNIGGFFASALIALNPILLHRTMAGFSDTDGYNILFFLLAIWFFIEAIDTKKLWTRITYTVLVAVSLALYAWAWEGWYVTAFLIVGTAIASIIAALIKDVIVHKGDFKSLKHDEHFRETTKSRGTILLTLLLSIPVVFAIMGRGFGTILTGLFTAITKQAEIQAAVNVQNLWPNILTTVAELSNPPFAQIISQSVGVGSFSSFLFYFGIFGIVVLAFRNFSWGEGLKSIELTYPILFTFWLVGTLYMSTTGTRFIMFVAPVIAILIGINFGVLANTLKKHSHSWFDLPKKATQIGAPIVISCIALFLIWPAFAQANLISQNSFPMMDDTMYNLLTDIKENSEPDAIISSWWDFGHIYITISGRGATGDGTSQKSISTTWLGMALVENNPEQFVGMSRMLNCGSSEHYEKLELLLNGDAIIATEVVNSAFGKTQSKAAQIYQEAGLSAQDAQMVASGTHCDVNPQSYWIASDDMIGKAPVWAHFGLWNFTKAKMWQLRRNEPEFITFVKEQNVVTTDVEARNLRRTLLAYNEEQGNAWIAKWPRYYTTDLRCTRQSGSTLITCPIMANLDQQTRLMNATYNTQTQEFSMTVVQGATSQILTPKKGTIVVNGAYVVREYDLASMDIGLSMIEQSDGTYRAILADAELVDSMFHRMYFMDGVGLEHILTKQYDVRGSNGVHFKVFERTRDFD